MAPSRIVDVSASVNLPLHHKVQEFSSGTGTPGWSRKKGHKTVVVTWVSWYQSVLHVSRASRTRQQPKCKEVNLTNNKPWFIQAADTLSIDACRLCGNYCIQCPVWARDTPLIHSLPTFCSFTFPFLLFLFFLSTLFFSIPSLSTWIVPLRFWAGGRRRRPNLGLVLCYLYFSFKDARLFFVVFCWV